MALCESIPNGEHRMHMPPRVQGNNNRVWFGGALESRPSGTGTADWAGEVHLQHKPLLGGPNSSKHRPSQTGVLMSPGLSPVEFSSSSPKIHVWALISPCCPCFPFILQPSNHPHPPSPPPSSPPYQQVPASLFQLHCDPFFLRRFRLPPLSEPFDDPHSFDPASTDSQRRVYSSPRFYPPYFPDDIRDTLSNLTSTIAVVHRQSNNRSRPPRPPPTSRPSTTWSTICPRLSPVIATMMIASRVPWWTS